ncbi:MAG: AAA family ATPase [Bacteroidales bacterium]|nr:AAA family ATPase [Bacteroidales bacterium]
MNYHLISPRVDGQTISGFIDIMFEKSIVMMGWGTDKPIGMSFSNIEKGDFVIVAQRVNWKFNYYFAGIVSSDSVYMEDGCQCRKIEHLIDLRNTKKDFLGNASFAEARVIKALITINQFNNKEVIKQLDNIIYNRIDMEKYISILTNNKNLIFTGAPGTGKTYLAKQIAAQMILGCEYDENNPEHKVKMDEQFDFVQFHPSFDYTDFVEGLRPVQDKQGNIGFKREDGILMVFCRKALKAYNEAENKKDAPKYIFVIDEINRGELSKIFGELFFSIDPGYRGSKGKVKTQYANLWKSDLDMFDGGRSFFIPKNVYIIGTMNDIDRSVESMDFAMRRRFAFVEVKVGTRVSMIEENEKLSGKAPEIIERMNNLNLCILKIQGLNSAYQIGASYFLKLGNYLDENGDLIESSWNSLWNNHLKGLLFEYLRGFPNADLDLNKLEKAYRLTDKYRKDVNGKIIIEDNNNE